MKMYKNLILGLVVALSLSCLYEGPTPEVAATGGNTTPSTDSTSSSEPTAPGVLLCQDTGTAPVGNQVCFNTEILPLIVSNCATSGCHDAISREDGYQLTSYKTIVSKGINTGKPQDSKLYKVMIDTGDDRMPPSAPLTKAQTDLFLKWIQQGAKETICTPSVDTANATFAKTVEPMLNTYCVGCHKAGATSGGVRLDSYTYVKVYVDNQKLWGSMLYQPGYKPMPPTEKLSDCQLVVLQKWIKQGALNN